MTEVHANDAEQRELEAIQAAYAVIQARDGTAERRAWHWQVTALIALVGLIGLGLWDHLDWRVEWSQPTRA
jgi:hypothetical protein